MLKVLQVVIVLGSLALVSVLFGLRAMAPLRLRLPGSVFIALVALACGLPFSAAMAMSSGKEFPPSLILVAPLVTFFALLGLFGTAELAGRLSGYRPAVLDWREPARAGSVEARLRAVEDEMRRMGFEVAASSASRRVFRRKAKIGGKLLDGIVDSAAQASLLASCAASPARDGSDTWSVRVKVATVIFWDTGEAAICRRIGERMVEVARAAA